MEAVRSGDNIPQGLGCPGAANCARWNNYARQPYKATMLSLGTVKRFVCKADR